MARRPSQRLRRALADLAAALDTVDAPSMIIGGIAVIAHGVARQTIDIDGTVHAGRASTSQLLAALAERSIRPRVANFEEVLQNSQVLLLRHEPTRVTLEISLAFSSFEHLALERAASVDFGGVRIRIATPEDLVIYKALAWRDRDRYDIEQLLVLHGAAIDLDRVRPLVREFADILGEPTRVAGFEELVRRTS